MDRLLDEIEFPSDLRRLNASDSAELAREIRSFLVKHISETGGHLSSNLGIVELSIALHQCFDTPQDKIIWDVGHQCYVHKIVTGRKDKFQTLRKEGGISGFPKSEESEYDIFDTGHATTSLSQAYGLCKARDLQKEDYRVVCVIGDGSMSGGMAYEAMNNIGRDKTNLIMVLNDNEMSISHSVGGLSTHLGDLRTRNNYLKSKEQMKKAVSQNPKLTPLYKASHYVKDRIKYMVTEGVLFEELGITYLGPVDGHNFEDLYKAFGQAKKLKEPVLIHVITKKGKGYTPAEERPEDYHGIGPFDVATGLPQNTRNADRTYADVFGDAICDLCCHDPRMVLVTAAMKQGTGLSKCSKVKERIFDVGIAEEHAVTFASGLAKGGMKPVVAVYSTFLQRAYDQILHDVCIPHLPVVFALDHSGVVGDDGETHQGIFDLAYLTHIPGMTVMAPSSAEELRRMLEYAVALGGPVAVRYPKGIAESIPETDTRIEQGKGIWLSSYIENKGECPRVTIVALGSTVKDALKAAEKLKGTAEVFVADARFAAPLDEELLEKAFAESELVVTVEDHVHASGFGMSVEALAKEKEWATPCVSISLPDAFLKQDTRTHTLEKYGVSCEGIVEAVVRHFERI